MKSTVKKYIDEIIEAFPIYNMKTRKFVKDLEKNIYRYTAQHEVSSIKDLYKRFGDPSEIVEDYFDYIKASEITSGLSNRNIKIIVLVSIVLLFVLWFSIHRTFIKLKDQNGNTGSTLYTKEEIIYKNGDKVKESFVESRGGKKIKETYITYKNNEKILEHHIESRGCKKIKEITTEYRKNGENIRTEKTYE